jgi:hypothetical protein
VLTEETVGSIHNSIQDLTRYFQWIPHWFRLPYVFGIIINRTNISIGKLVQNGFYYQFFSSALVTPVMKLNVVGVIMKMACVLKYFVQTLFINVASTIPINGNWNERADKFIRIGLKFVEHKFTAENQDRFNFLKAMYTATQNINLKEKLVDLTVAKQFSDSNRIIRLEPIGINMEPETNAQLKTCLRNILTCLQDLHAAGYVHCDITWSNVIFVNSSWYLIDFTSAQSLTSESGLRRIARKIRSNFVYQRHDFYQVGKLIEGCAIGEKKRFRNVRKALLEDATLDITQLLADIAGIRD